MKSLIKEPNVCPHCAHHKAWSKATGTFCTSCGRDINEPRYAPKKMRSPGVHPKEKWR